ncbi:MAG: ATP-binding protein [Cytophagales bacterium]|nr:ATP-binding protein [Cytophagales bacterium]
MLRIAAACFLLVCTIPLVSQSWEVAQTNKSAKLDIYWYVSRPFIYEDGNGNLTGIEYELIELFSEFLQEKYKVDLESNLIEAASFSNIMEEVNRATNPNVFGASAFSITPARQEVLQFTAPYLPDIAVLVSSQGSAIVQTPEEIEEMMHKMVAVTIAGTTYENFLSDLQQRLNLEFELMYIDSDQNVLDKISQAPNRFGYIDLPIYLMLIKRGGDLTRQNIFTIRGTGYGLIMPQNSDWDIPFNEFLNDTKYRTQIDAIFSEFLGPELFEFLEELETETQLGTSILTKEKELQLELIRNAQLRIAEQESYNRLLTAGTIFSLISGLIILWLFVRNKRTTLELVARKNEVENQQIALQEKSQQLIARNAGLIALNEEKNNFVRILAHDLRSPLSQIIGIADILAAEHKASDDTQKELLSKISEGGHRINEMIDKILNVEYLEGMNSPTVLEQVKIAPLLEEVAQRFASRAREKGIGISINNCDKDFELMSDHVLLLQILDNLMSNAIKFSPHNAQVTIAAQVNHQKLVFKVTDQGPGFSESDKTLMFNKFQKLSAQPTGNESSTGLGLSIVKRYVDELNGKISFETEVGKGTTFFVQFEW